MMRLTLFLLVSMVPALMPGPRRHVVEMKDFQFKPLVLRVAAGDTVVFENRDIAPHTATAADSAWDSGNIAAKARWTMVARKRGEQEFTCVYHSNMKGKLVVR